MNRAKVMDVVEDVEIGGLKWLELKNKRKGL